MPFEPHIEDALAKLPPDQAETARGLIDRALAAPAPVRLALENVLERGAQDLAAEFEQECRRLLGGPEP